jgi:hypothetical protein
MKHSGTFVTSWGKRLAAGVAVLVLHEAAVVAQENPNRRWTATIVKQVNGGGHNHRITIDAVFEVDPQGKINGRARARVTTSAGEVPGCRFLWTYSPSEFDMPVSGHRDGEQLEIVLEPGPVTATVQSSCSGSQSGTIQLNPAIYATTRYVVPARDGANDTVERFQGAQPWGVAQRDTILIQVPTEVVPRG